MKLLIATAINIAITLALATSGYAAPQPTDAATMGIRTSIAPGPKLIAPPRAIEVTDDAFGTIEPDAKTMSCARIAGQVTNATWFAYGCDKLVDLE